MPPPPVLVDADIVNFVHTGLTVTLGSTITWTNRDQVVHTVTSGRPNALTGLFDSGTFPFQGQFSLTFDTPGVFPYFCTVHPFMQATITVQ